MLWRNIWVCTTILHPLLHNYWNDKTRLHIDRSEERTRLTSFSSAHHYSRSSDFTHEGRANICGSPEDGGVWGWWQSDQSQYLWAPGAHVQGGVWKYIWEQQWEREYVSLTRVSIYEPLVLMSKEEWNYVQGAAMRTWVCLIDQSKYLWAPLCSCPRRSLKLRTGSSNEYVSISHWPESVFMSPWCSCPRRSLKLRTASSNEYVSMSH